MTAITPDQLKAAVPRGMLAFPLTDFDANDAFDKKSRVARLDWLLSYQPAAFFLAGGAGEFFSLTPAEFSAAVVAGVESCGGKLPVVAASGYCTRTAIGYSKEAERLGANGLNKLPGVSCATPKGAFYAFPNVKRTGWKAQEFATALLDEAGVAIIGGPDFDILGEGCVLLFYANSTENILKAVARMNEFLSKRKAA